MSTNSIIMMIIAVLANWGGAVWVIRRIMKSEDQDFTKEADGGIGA